MNKPTNDGSQQGSAIVLWDSIYFTMSYRVVARARAELNIAGDRAFGGALDFFVAAHHASYGSPPSRSPASDATGNPAVAISVTAAFSLDWQAFGLDWLGRGGDRPA
jgi:hypothetical protein